jgi:hypothetical protein
MLKPHDISRIFPAMSAEAFAALKADIAANGVHEPIVIYEGKILDGRNRYRACTEAGIEPPSRTYTGDDPLGFVVSLNLHRRHLSESQRAAVASEIANLPNHRPARAGSGQICPLPESAPVSIPQAAKMLNVSERSVKSAKVVRDHGTPALFGAVQQGKVSVSRAAKVARLPREEQDAALKVDKASVKAARKRGDIPIRRAVTPGLPVQRQMMPCPHCKGTGRIILESSVSLPFGTDRSTLKS